MTVIGIFIGHHVNNTAEFLRRLVSEIQPKLEINRNCLRLVSIESIWLKDANEESKKTQAKLLLIVSD